MVDKKLEQMIGSKNDGKAGWFRGSRDSRKPGKKQLSARKDQ